ncbi:ATP-dependent Lon protease [Clostridium saccharoperbutylacetonicum]|uniref:Lon protease n=1 Tax=Clostridium saccharoperbutylacetonicum N1-4(HMT) TaxID=931276 RepID=M1LQS4_9CLOT|nr:endopeptidase La [Clostridium saccharoperbutylacetonicum]AGF55220.1 Lon protease Lon [Clostridium saccharoperbutylacetonicum N1-4(HMT)]NRT64069.1 ATP-dependent Lon protease [Clostridium saccharoperbutylacetonicum]NSB27436.1 ATP-dependent Lon protease [Clostridium saccharoperbutylacetonicum]NSB40925.1 ATP-dependent Lon protease [Clostridium saccharoperbutylacetonicum]
MMNLDRKNTKAVVIPISNMVLLANMTHKLKFSRISDEQYERLNSENQPIIVLPLKQNFNQVQLKEEDFHRVGVLIQIDGIEKSQKGYEFAIKVLDRVEVKSIEVGEDFVNAEFETASDIIDLTEKSKEEMLEYMKNVTYDISKNFDGAEPIVRKIENQKDLNKLIGYLVQFMPLSNDEKYDLMETQSIKDRGLKFMDYLLKQKEALKLQFEMAEKFTEKANKNYRETVLRQQLKAIQDELNEGKNGSPKGEKDYLKQIEEAGMPEEIKEAALYELEKLESQGQNGSEYNVIRNYLELLIKLPWKKSEATMVNLEEARRILDDQHYGLEKVKDRIIQHLAVMQLKKDKKGSILLLVGPPGTGKTSLGKSIAEALGRKYIRLSLGGVRDEAEIRGHRRTYVGAMPGRIIQSIKKAGENNPVMILDEVDKLMTGYNGDPAAALLEVLDPEQNNTFTDHYLDLPYDLSDVFFIATANSLETIPRPLLDRMEVIQISSYTINEKFHIGKNHLIPAILEEHGLNETQLVVEDEALEKTISEYTLEAGVRGLKKQLATIARVASEKIVSNKVELPFKVTVDQLETLLGRKVSRHDKAQDDNPPGVVTGLAWTSVGGEILFIEATDMPGSGQVILTGQLGDVMKESARISLSLLKSRLPMNTVNFREKDLHIHVPSGSVPKDGPSAGITLFTALASLVTGIKVNSKIAMTGEITLRGAVLPIGGLKEKLLGAQRAGITKVLIPKDNLIDLKDVPEEVRKELTIVAVETVEDVLRETLGISLPKVEHVVNFNISPEGTLNSR